MDLTPEGGQLNQYKKHHATLPQNNYQTKYIGFTT